MSSLLHTNTCRPRLEEFIGTVYGDFEQLAFKHGLVGAGGFDDLDQEVVFPMSARTGTGFDAFKRMLVQRAPLRPW